MFSGAKMKTNECKDKAKISFSGRQSEVEEERAYHKSQEKSRLVYFD